MPANPEINLPDAIRDTAFQESSIENDAIYFLAKLPNHHGETRENWVFFLLRATQETPVWTVKKVNVLLNFSKPPSINGRAALRKSFPVNCSMSCSSVRVDGSTMSWRNKLLERGITQV